MENYLNCLAKSGAILFYLWTLQTLWNEWTWINQHIYHTVSERRVLKYILYHALALISQQESRLCEWETFNLHGRVLYIFHTAFKNPRFPSFHVSVCSSFACGTNTTQPNEHFILLDVQTLKTTWCYVELCKSCTKYIHVNS